MILALLAPPAEPAPAPPAPTPLRAQYGWGYAGEDGEGKGTLSLLLEPASGKVVLEVHGLGERLVFLSGDRSGGYRVQIPRQRVDERASSLDALPLPFLPRIGSCEGLYRLLSEGTGAGIKVTRRDGQGPLKLRFEGKDDRGREVTVWLERTRWEPLPSPPGP